MGDGDDLVFQIEGDEQERSHENAEDCIDLQVGLGEAIQIGLPHHAQEMTGVNIRADGGHGDTGPPQAVRAEKILVDGYVLDPTP